MAILDKGKMTVMSLHHVCLLVMHPQESRYALYCNVETPNVNCSNLCVYSSVNSHMPY